MDKYNVNSPDWARGLIRTVKILNNLYGKKEVRKMSRPYLELEIVKIKKPQYQCREVKKFMGKKYEVFIKDGEVSIKRHKHQIKPKGNWINGENLDAIKFPCFCRWLYQGRKCYGEINTNYNEHKMELEYELSDITYQVNGKIIGNRYSVIYSSFSLKDLIKIHDIHILKGKIIIFEEEK